MKKSMKPKKKRAEKVMSHLKHDISESKESIGEDKALMKKLRKKG